eukprot:9013145-Pyramimonas_sp.AAC.1
MATKTCLAETVVFYHIGAIFYEPCTQECRDGRGWSLGLWSLGGACPGAATASTLQMLEHLEAEVLPDV